MIFDKMQNPNNNENLKKLCNRCREHLISQLETVIPEKGKIKGFQVHFKNIVKGWYMADCGLRIVQSYKGDDMRCVEIYATFPDRSGYEIKYILFHGTNSDVTAFMSDEGFTASMIENYAQLSESIADKI